MRTGYGRGVTTNEADDAAEWARVMVDRHGLGDVGHLTAEGDAMSVRGYRAGGRVPPLTFGADRLTMRGSPARSAGRVQAKTPASKDQL